MILLSHPTGNSFVRNTLIALEERGLLAEFWTGLNWKKGTAADRVLPGSLRRTLERRSFRECSGGKVRTAPFREIGRMMSRRLNAGWLTRHEYGIFSVDAVYRSLDRKVARRLREPSDIKAVYAYEDGADETFQEAEKAGIKRLYDLPIGYWRVAREMYLEEAQLEPAWAPTLPGKGNSVEKNDRKEEEIRRADAIIVPSEFAKKTLKKAPVNAPVHVVPFGAPGIVGGSPRVTGAGKKMKVLFVGALTQRKGIAYLVRAVEALSGLVELTMVGRRVGGQCKALDKAIRENNWIPTLSHGEVLGQMDRHDVLVLPSLFEGFALVIPEAMSRGLPVIITPNTGGEGTVENGKEGFIVPVRDSAAIAQKLEALALDAGKLEAMSKASMEKAATYSWAKYRERIGGIAENAAAL
jgi:alpha-maltose-1-phosphate synthase